MDDRLRRIALDDGRFAPEAYRFLLESLEQAIQIAGRDHLEGPERHVTGSEVLAGLVSHAKRSFGPLAAQVWRSWGITEAMDWGRIVFALVEAGMLSRQETDSIEDFRSDMDFDVEFVSGYAIQVPREL